MNKYYALQKDVFDINKVTVVGSPTITSDGVASGFSDSNYLKTSFFPITSTSVIKLKIKAKLPDSLPSTGYGTIFSPNNVVFGGFFFSTLQFNTNGVFTLYAWDTTNYGAITSSSITSYLGQDIYIECEISNAQRRLRILTEDSTLISDTKSTLQMSWVGSNANYSYLIGKLYTNNDYIFQGSIDLTQFKIYVDNQLVFQPVKPTYLLERRKPTVWNKGQFTIVGNPSISDDGIVSGFSSSNYIRVPYRPLGQNFKIFTPRFNSSDVSQQQKIVRYSDGNIRVEIYQNKIRLYRYSGNNVYDLPVGNTTLQNNQDYYYYVEQTTDGTNYYLKGYISTDNENWTLDIDKTYTVAMYDYQNNAPIQIGGVDAIQPFIGTLNLKQFKIYTDNNLVFDGGADTYVYDPSKFTVLGSPTITEYGVASGFSSSNYLTVPIPTELVGNPEKWTMTTKFHFDYVTGASSVQCIFCNEKVNSSTGLLSWVSNSANSDSSSVRIRLYNSSNNTIIDFETAYTDNVMHKNTTYFVKAEYDNLHFVYSISEDGKNWTNLYNNNISEAPYFESGCNITIGTRARDLSAYILNSIDLTQFSITVDGKEVFTGAKEVYYALRR